MTPLKPRDAFGPRLNGPAGSIDDVIQASVVPAACRATCGNDKQSMLTGLEARELSRKYRNLANRTGISSRRKNLFQGIARSYSALASQLQMLHEAEKAQGDKTDAEPLS
jgi:hypothetical protein